MYRGASLVCPACSATLEYTRASLPTHACRGCGGLWLGPEAAMHVFQGGGGALGVELTSDDPRASPAPSVEPTSPDDGVRPCPSCGVVMGKLSIGDVRLDSCPAHGTWFDRLELTRIVEELAEVERRAKVQSSEEGLPSIGDLLRDSKEVADFVVFSFPSQVVKWLVEWAERARERRWMEERYRR